MQLSEQEQFTLDVITRNEFIVRVDGKDTDELRVDYAGKLKTDYSYYSEDTYGIRYQNSSAQTQEFIDLPYYLLRLYVLLDIYRQCRRLSLPYSAVWFFRENGERSDLKDLWQLNLSDNERENEKRFNGYVRELFEGEPLNKFDNDLETDSLLHQFTILKGLLL